jgi:hypothetical protein
MECNLRIFVLIKKDILRYDIHREFFVGVLSANGKGVIFPSLFLLYAAVKRRLYVCCSYSQTIVITVLKSVARIRLVTNEKTWRVLVICKVWRSAIVL